MVAFKWIVMNGIKSLIGFEVFIELGELVPYTRVQYL